MSHIDPWICVVYPQIEKPIVLATGLLAEAALDQITKHLAVESWLLLWFILTKQTKVASWIRSAHLQAEGLG